MKSVKERAKEYADNYVVGDSSIIADLLHKVAEESYIKGDADRKAIDDAEFAEVRKQRDAYYDELISKRLRIAELESFVERATALIEAEKAYREHLEAKEKNIINKAWRWMEENQAHIISESGVWLMWTAFEDAFRKAMEE